MIRTNRCFVTLPSMAIAVMLAACGSSTPKATGSTNPTNPAATSTANGAAVDLTAGYRQAKWGTNTTVTFADGKLRFVSNGIPNHSRDAEYALPNTGVMVPVATTAHAAADPTVAQNYDYSIPLTPKPAAKTTSTSLGVIGVMISGAALFNPYEGDGSTVAKQSNFSVKNASGTAVSFLDACNGHPTPMGQYHYHALPPCVTATVDAQGGPSHLIGIAFDGYPIYGDRDSTGKQVAAADLDACNGITSATPEFPKGVYHYVMLDVADASSSIRCFTGAVDSSLTTAMPGMGGPPANG